MYFYLRCMGVIRTSRGGDTLYLCLCFCSEDSIFWRTDVLFFVLGIIMGRNIVWKLCYLWHSTIPLDFLLLRTMLKPFVTDFFLNRIQHVWHWHRCLNVRLLEAFQVEQREEVRLSVWSISGLLFFFFFVFNGAQVEVHFLLILLLSFRRMQIEEMEARIALMPLLQAEHDRRWAAV